MEQNIGNDTSGVASKVENDIENPSNLDLKNIFTIGGIIGFIIAGAFGVRAYLDILRIKKLKSEMKNL